MIGEAIKSIQQTLPEGVRLIAVSKFHSETDILEAYKAGQRLFGENHVQELTQKHESLPADIEWHFIGHLQTNKVKYIAPFVSLIHSIDSLKLLKVVDKEAAKVNRIIPCLLQMHIAQEETKFGFSREECLEMLNFGALSELKHVQICGLMGMATNTDNTAQVKKEFHSLHTFFEELKQTYFHEDAAFKELSMGMSEDYPIAIEEGSTLIRVGTMIFGQRDYSKKTL
ncbi:MAG: YggS family pyridoxal phosphate-dependent enzyme [Bacteroidales bacterium]|nr:YggS family pyridoxal phosphate-dependent enzyme [Bacteroidales bacterium]